MNAPRRRPSEAKVAARRVTANLPAPLLEQACLVTGRGVTETLVRGLELVRRTAAVTKARKLRGKLELQIDLRASRERSAD